MSKCELIKKTLNQQKQPYGRRILNEQPGITIRGRIYILKQQLMNSAQGRAVPNNPVHSEINPRGVDLIKETKVLVEKKSETYRFKMAKRQLFNALDFKKVRLDIYLPETPRSAKIVYQVQTFYLWRRFMVLLAYLFMYAAFFGHVRPSWTLIGIEWGFLSVMFADMLLEVYHKSYQFLRPHSKFEPKFYVRLVALGLLLADTIIAASTQSLPVRPLLIVRCVLPIVYDEQIRKIFMAIMASYIDIFVYVIFYVFIIVGFAVMANQFVEVPPSATYDDFTQNYGALGKTIFLMYVLTTFDAYPDNQIIAIDFSMWMYLFFIVFIFLNALFFVTIPTNILLKSVKEVRSKTTIIDELEQQHHLIMAFVTLGGDTRTSISYEKVIRFLLFLFNNDIKYLNKISEICRCLDEKVNGTIEVNEFMQICKIIQSRKYLKPPRFSFWRKLNTFQKFIDNQLGLRHILNSPRFAVFTALLILFTFVNCILTMYTRSVVFDVIDDVLIMLFIAEVLFKFIALGPLDFFSRNWNNIDLVICIVGFVLEVAPQEIVPRNSAVIIKMVRIFRVTLLIDILADWCKLSYRNQVYTKFTEMVTQIALILPIVFKFFPLYMISFYFLGTVGVQAFWAQTDIKPEDSHYSVYDKYSNFRSLLGSQFIFVQIFTEAGWSLVAYDHALRYGFFALTMLFFVLAHEIIVIIITSLLKGVTWEVYDAIHREHQAEKNRVLAEQKVSRALRERLDLFEEVKAKIEGNEKLLPDNLITREIYEKKIDLEIMSKLLQLEAKSKGAYFDKSYKSKLSISSLKADKENGTHMADNVNPYAREKEIRFKRTDSIRYNSQAPERIESAQQLIIPTQSSRSIEIQGPLLASSQDIQEVDIEMEIDDFLQQNDLSGMKYSIKVDHSPAFASYLHSKLRPLLPYRQEEEFDLDRHTFSQPKSFDFLVHGLHTLLELETTDREQRAMVINAMLNRGIITNEKAAKLKSEKVEYEDALMFDHNWIIRQVYLSEINEERVSKFEIEYFSGIYGRSFREINKVSIYPFLRLEARLLYCFNNLIRYKPISTFEFFHTLAYIQNKISNKLLQVGSLFKFAFQIDANNETWFTFELKETKELRIHFIKNGVWAYSDRMSKEEVYNAKDVFHYKGVEEMPDGNQCCEQIKKFYQTFEGLALCLSDYYKFFKPQPEYETYDLYTLYRNVQNTERYTKDHPMSISKIMLVLLSKQQTRQHKLGYSLSDIRFSPEELEKSQRRRSMHYRIDETETQMFERLEKFGLEDDELISDSEGIPFTYIVNLLTSLNESMATHDKNFVFHVEKLLNNVFSTARSEKLNNTPDMASSPSMPPRLD